jgi:glycerol-3-phosphate O-acyltransferase
VNAEDPLLPVRDERATRSGSAMLRQFGWFYTLLGLGRVLSTVRFEEHSVDRIRQAAAKGPVVYVLLRRSTLDHLTLNTVLNRRRLPISAWSNGATSFTWQPVAEAWRDVFSRVGRRLRARRRADPVRSGWLADAVAEGATATVFLEDGRTDGPAPEDDPLRAVLEAQDRLGRAEHGPGGARSIQLVPVICVWERSPEGYATEVRDFLLGSRDAPSLLTKLGALYLGADPRPFVQVGEPLDLATFVARATPARRLDSLRTLLRRFLKREGRVVRGPRLLPRHVLRSLVLDAPPMRRFAEDEAAAQKTSVAVIRKKMEREFDTVAANFSFSVIRFLSIAMRPIWTRVYSGYDIRPEDLERIRAAMREGTAVLAPCHKSHFDYLLLSWVLFWDDLIVPHIIAGINLAIWPVHYLLRGAGAFFIRRSFKDDRIHPRVFGRYLRELLLHGYTVEFFVEGGRTRSGKLMPPKLGVLDMVLEAAETAPPGHEITLLPIGISYEQVAEERSYQSELDGAKKKEENLGELIAARSVLTRRYGRVYVRVGEPVKGSDVVRRLRGADEAGRREVLKATGERLVHRIGQAIVVLPTNLVAMALVAHHRHGIRHTELMARLTRFHALMKQTGAEEAEKLERFESSVQGALDRFLREGRIRRLGTPEDRVWEIVPEHRVLLDFHKNQVLHHVARPVLVSAVVHALPGPTFGEDDVRDGLRWLERLFRREFVPDPDAVPDDRLRAALLVLADHGALARDGRAWRVSDPLRMGEIHGLVRALLESYLLVVEAVRRAADKPVDGKALVTELQAQKGTWLAAGVASRPEAFSAVALQNALSALGDLGIATKNADGRLVVDRAALDAVHARLAPMIGP